MPMGIVSNTDFDKELKNATPISSPTISPSVKSEVKIPEIIEAPTKGRGDNNVEVPNSLRQIIGETSAIHGRAEGVDLANRFGISGSSVSAYANGATSTATYDETPNKKPIASAKLRLAGRARRLAVRAIDAITESKLNETKARDLAAIARDMAVVVKVMDPTPEIAPMNNNGPTFVYYAPQIKQESEYPKIFVKE